MGGREGVRVPAVHAWVLGRFAVELDGRLLTDADWRGRRQAHDLLAYLLIRPGYSALVDEAMEALWGDRSAETAQQTLYRSSSQLRTLLGKASERGPAIVIGGGRVALNPRWTISVDLTAFEAAVKRAQQSKGEADCAAALAQYGGAVLPDKRYADWPGGRRREVERGRAWLLEALGEHAIARHDPAAALDLGQQLVGLEPWNDRAHRRIMRALADLGRRTEAVRFYRRLAARIERELETVPAAETRRLYEQLIAADEAAVVGRSPAPPGVGAAKVSAATTADAPPMPEAPPLVGRQQELARLAGMLADLPPRSGAALLGGESGIGKTRLAREVCRMAEARGVPVLMGSCRAEPDCVPYGPIAEALAAYLRARGRRGAASDKRGVAASDAATLSPAEAEALLAGCKPLLRLVPEFAGEEVVRERISLEQEQRLIWHAAVTWLGQVAGDRGVVLFLDDLHWADDQSVALLRQVLTRLEEVPILVIGTYRDTDVDSASAFGRLLNDVYRQRLARRIPVQRLAQTEVATLLTHVLGVQPSDQLLAAVYDRTSGNPLFVEGLAEGLLHSGVLVEREDRLHAPGDVHIPEELAESVRQRCAFLTPAAQRLLETAAVAGEQIEHLVLAPASGLTPDALLDALDQVRARRLLVDEGEGYAFQHKLVRDVLYDDLSVGRRMLLHRRVATALEAVAGGRLDELSAALAHHWAEAGDAPLRAAEFAYRAGEWVRKLGAVDQAIASFRQTLEQLDRAGQTRGPRRHEVLIGLAKAQGMAGQPDSARASLEAALVLAEALEQRAHVRRLLGDIDQRRGAYAAALEQYQRGLALLEGQASVERGRLLLAAATVSFRLGRHSEAVPLLQAGVSALGESGERRDAGHAASVAAGEAYFRGALDEARVWLERSLEHCRAARDLGGQSRALCGLGLIYDARGQIGMARPRFEDALLLARRAGYPNEQARALLGLAAADGLAGQLDAALANAESALSIAKRADFTSLIPECHLRLAELYWLSEDHAATMEQIQLSQSTARSGTEPSVLARLHALLGRVHLASGQPGEASEAFRRAVDLASGMPLSEEHAEAAGLLGVSLLALGDDEADAWLSRGLDVCDRSGYALCACEIHLALWMACRGHGQPARADRALALAQGIANRLTLPGLTAAVDRAASAHLCYTGD